MKNEITDLPIKPVLLTNNEDDDSLNIDALSDDDLDKILLKKPEPKQNSLGSVEEKKLDLKHLSRKKKVTKIKDVVKKELSKIKKKELGITKRDPVSIKELAEKELERQNSLSIKGHIQKKWRDEETNNILLSKQSTKELLTKAERKKVFVHNQINREKIQNEICKKRTILKELNKQVLLKKECNCVDKFSYIGETGIIITVCEKCSRIKEWKNVNEWYKYINEQNKEKKNESKSERK